eukprot:scaffold3017_cov81-Cylindrotheca_fusiformis.AAC.4
MGEEEDQEKGGEAADVSDETDITRLCGVPRMTFFCLILSHLVAIAIGAGVTAGVLQSKGDDCEISTPKAASSSIPTSSPFSVPNSSPFSIPSSTPSLVPTSSPFSIPTSTPSLVPTSTPSLVPTSTPSLVPTSTPSSIPTLTPTLDPTSTPSLNPTDGELSDTELLARVVLPGVDIADLEETSPQYHSLEWLAVEDSRSLNIEDDATELIERFSLVTIYFASDGENWNFQSLWLSILSHCEWYAINCDENGRVTALTLQNGNMHGTLPPEIGNFRNARSIEFSFNSIEGSIPTEIGLLTSATELRLQQNSMVGTLPTEIGNLNRLVDLYVSNNQLEGTIPDEIGYLQQLTSLYLNDNTFSGTIPREIGILQQLSWLALSINNLSGTIPSELGNLRQLVTLELDRNIGLTGTVPVEVGQLESIRNAHFFATSLTGGLDDLAFCMNRNSLGADCKGIDPKITCECCTMCCDTDGDNCVYF